MHPIHYSFWLNALILVVTGALTYHLGNPLVLVIGFYAMQHFVGKFEDDEQEAPEQVDHSDVSFGFVPGQQGSD